MSLRRLSDLRRKIAAENLDGFVVTHLDHVRYLTGFTGTAGLLVVSPARADFITDSRYADQARKQVKGARVHIFTGQAIASLQKVEGIGGHNVRFGVNEEYVTLATRDRLAAALDGSLLVPAGSLCKELGWVKDNDEIRSIERAARISDDAFKHVLTFVRPGVRESELCAELEFRMAKLGSERPAFETIVASGYRSAMPHGVASRKKVEKGDFITFDFGSTVNGYVSDITRTVVVGKATSRQKKIYNIVLKAQEAGVAKVRAGIPAKDVDSACRKIIERAGFGKNFGHGTGHGIGFYIHVGPSVSSASNDKLMVNNVITIEPGIYLSGWGGVRIEDDVVVTKSGGRVLNRAPKKLLEL